MSRPGRDIEVGNQFTRELKSTTKVEEDNSIMMLDATDVVALCDNTKIPYACFFGTTKDRISLKIGVDKFLLGSEINSKSPLFRSGWAEVPLDIDHGAIGIGDMLVVGPTDNGRVVGEAGTGSGDPSVAADLLRRVGWAEEIIAAPGGGLRTQPAVLCVLDMHRGAP